MLACLILVFAQGAAALPVKRILIEEYRLPVVRVSAQEMAKYFGEFKAGQELRAYVESKGFRPKQKSSDLQFIESAMAWVTKQWVHNGWNEAPSDATALDILKKVHNEKVQYRCVEYGLVLAELLQAYGYAARSVGIQSKDADYGGLGRGHVATEIWSDELNKWLYFDPQFGSYMVDAKGLPLSFFEVFRLHSKSGWKEIKTIFLVKPDVADPDVAYRKFIENYFGSLTVTVGERRWRLGMATEKPLLTFQGMPTPYRTFTREVSDGYPALNQVEMTFKYDYEAPDSAPVFAELKDIKPEGYDAFFEKNLHRFAAKPKFLVQLRNNVFDFSHYEFARGGSSSKWERLKGDSISWNIKGSVEMLRVRGVNSRGRAGAESFVRIGYR